MHETTEDLRRLQAELDASYDGAGDHLRSVVTSERRLDSATVAEVLSGVCVLNLATVTAAGEPRVAPVDGLFYRGRFWFGSAPNSVRFQHIRHRPQVSGTHVRGESLGVIVHGRAVVVEQSGAEWAGFRDYLHEIYGPGWDDWGAGATYARIDADRVYAFSFADVARNAPAVHRIWHGWTTPDNAEAYQELLQSEVVPGIMARKVAGLRDLTILRRPRGELVEFITVMRFDDLDAVRAFVGEDYEAAYVPPAARALLDHWDERSAHYDHVTTITNEPA